jgi:CRISPR-associated protein Csb1
MDKTETVKSDDTRILEMSFEVLLRSLKNGSAFRQVTRLIPAGGSEDKVYPPTYTEGKEGSKYAYETRRTNTGTTVHTVLLDSVQSQANHMESALLDAIKNRRIDLPLLYVDFSDEFSDEFSDIGKISTLVAPHRIADAIFRESVLDGEEFRKTEIGKAFENSNIRNATGMFKYCTHALVFGIWDSTGPTGVGNKFQRTIVSEIIGMNAQ